MNLDNIPIKLEEVWINLNQKYIDNIFRDEPIQLTKKECDDIKGILCYMQGYYQASQSR